MEPVIHSHWKGAGGCIIGQCRCCTLKYKRLGCLSGRILQSTALRSTLSVSTPGRTFIDQILDTATMVSVSALIPDICTGQQADQIRHRPVLSWCKRQERVPRTHRRDGVHGVRNRARTVSHSVWDLGDKNNLTLGCRQCCHGRNLNCRTAYSARVRFR